MNKMFKKIFIPRIWRRFYIERAGEPFVYNLVSLFHFFFGSFKTKIDYDLVPRQPYAFGIKDAFEIATREKVEKLLLVEFGVASGAGLFNMSTIASRLSKSYNIDYEIIGFDTGKGMPEPEDFRDHPEKYRGGDFPPLALTSENLPPKCTIYYGDIESKLENFYVDYKETRAKLGFVSIDVDYYSSAKKCFELFTYNADFYMSHVPVYLDDVNNPEHNVYCGELLAARKFNQKEDYPRKVTKINQLRNWRIFKNALYLDQMYYLHVFDHKLRSVDSWKNEEVQIITNPYL